VTHLQTFVDTVLAIAFVEALLKPVTVRLSRRLIRFLDAQVHWIPNWLHTPN